MTDQVQIEILTGRHESALSPSEIRAQQLAAWQAFKTAPYPERSNIMQALIEWLFITVVTLALVLCAVLALYYSDECALVILPIVGLACLWRLVMIDTDER